MTLNRPTHEAAPTQTTRIQPRRGWVGLDAPELLANRELLFFLIWRDLKVRYRQTAFGLAWTVLRPILPMAIFTMLLSRVPGIAPQGVPYALFVLAALVPWGFFSQSVTGASASLVSSANLVQKVYFPRLLLPLGVIGASFLDFGITLVVLLLLAFVLVGGLPLSILLLLPLSLLLMLISLGIGAWFAAVNVRYRDVGHAVPFLMQLLLFLTPIFYSADLVPVEWRAIYGLNPMVGVVDGFRWATLGIGDPPVMSLAASAFVAVLLLVSGVAYFRRVERTFADVI